VLISVVVVVSDIVEVEVEVKVSVTLVEISTLLRRIRNATTNHYLGDCSCCRGDRCSHTCHTCARWGDGARIRDHNRDFWFECKCACISRRWYARWLLARQTSGAGGLRVG
jgi:hypothetical protein